MILCHAHVITFLDTKVIRQTNTKKKNNFDLKKKSHKTGARLLFYFLFQLTEKSIFPSLTQPQQQPNFSFEKKKLIKNTFPFIILWG